MCGYLTVQHLWHAASPDSHTLPAALGWKRTFGSRGRPRSPAHGGKEALTECEAVPLCRPHRTSHLGRGVREHSPHHYQINERSNRQGEGQKVVNPLRTERQPVVSVATKHLQLLAARENLGSFSHSLLTSIQALRDDMLQFHDIILCQNLVV